LLAPRHLIFTTLEGALVNSASANASSANALSGSFTGAEQALDELDRRHIAWIILTRHTRSEIEPLRRELQHTHPFVTENGGGIFFPDGYFNVRIPGAERAGRYLRVAQGRPYDEVISALDDIAAETNVGVTGFHNMSEREIAENTGLNRHDAERVRDREFDEPFFFTSADAQAIKRFVAAASEQGYAALPGEPFWHFSSGCDPARAVRSLAQMFRDATRSKFRVVGIGSGKEDLSWLRVVDHAIIVPEPGTESSGSDINIQKKITLADASGPAGWNEAILNEIKS